MANKSVIGHAEIFFKPNQIIFFWSTKQLTILNTTRWGGRGMWEGLFGCEFCTWVEVC